MSNPHTSFLFGWKRVQVLGLEGLIPYSWTSESMRIATLPSPSPLQTLRLRVDTFLSRRHHPDAASFVRALGKDDHYFGFQEGESRVVELVVKEEGERKEVEEVGGELDARWRELLVVTVEV